MTKHTIFDKRLQFRCNLCNRVRIFYSIDHAKRYARRFHKDTPTNTTLTNEALELLQAVASDRSVGHLDGRLQDRIAAALTAAPATEPTAQRWCHYPVTYGICGVAEGSHKLGANQEILGHDFVPPAALASPASELDYVFLGAGGAVFEAVTAEPCAYQFPGGSVRCWVLQENHSGKDFAHEFQQADESGGA